MGTRLHQKLPFRRARLTLRLSVAHSRYPCYRQVMALDWCLWKRKSTLVCCARAGLECRHHGRPLQCAQPSQRASRTGSFPADTDTSYAGRCKVKFLLRLFLSWHFSLEPVAATKPLVPKSAQQSPLFDMIAASVGFLGGISCLTTLTLIRDCKKFTPTH